METTGILHVRPLRLSQAVGLEDAKLFSLCSQPALS